MTLKFYSRVLLAAMTLVFFATGCKDDETPPPSEKYTFDIAASDITAADVVVKVTPSDLQATYYKKADFDKIGTDDAYLKDDIEYLKAEAEKKQLSFKAYLETVVAKGSEPQKFIGLTASTDYYAYVYGITVDGKVTSDLKKTPFTTEAAPEPEGLSFEFSVENITLTGADVSVIPSNDEDTYYFDVQMVAAFEGMTEDEMLAAIMADYFDASALVQGPDGYPAMIFEYFPLKPATEYYVYAFGADADGNVTSELFTYKFTTKAPTGDAPDLTLSARAGDADGKNTWNNIYCSALSEAAVSGKFVCLPKAAVDDFLGQGATLENIVDTNGDAMDEEFLSFLTTKPGLGLTLAGESIVPETEYTVIFKVVSAGGMVTVKSADATTAAESKPSDLTFSIAVTDLKSTSATVTVTPSNNTDTYFFDIQPKGFIDREFPDDASLIAALDAAYAQYGGIAGMLSTGVDSYPLKDLDPGTSYYVLAFGYTSAATTAVTRYEFKTEASAPADLTLTINVDAAVPVPGGVTATITASNDDDTYILDFILADDIQGASDADIISIVEQKYEGYIQWLLTSGNYVTYPTDFSGTLAMMPGAEYYLVAFGHDGTSATTGVVKTKFTAGAGPDAAGTGFTFKIEDITSSGASVTVNATKQPVIYMWDVISEANYTQLGGTPAALSDYVKGMFTLYGSDDYGNLTPRQVIAGLGAWYSGAYYIYGKFSPKTAYRPFAVCVDVNGNVVDTPVVGDTFTTLEAVVGSATVEVSCSKYYNGDEVAAAGGSASAAGKAFVPTTATPSSNAAHWYFQMYGADYSDPTSLSDATIISALLKDGKKDVKSMNYLSAWDTTCTYLAVAEDANGNMGTVFRKTVRFSKSGVSPISDLVGPSKAAVTGNRPVLCSSLLPELAVPKVYRPIEPKTMTGDAVSQIVNTRQMRAVAAVSEKLAKGAVLSGAADAVSGAKLGTLEHYIGKNAGQERLVKNSLKEAASKISAKPKVRTPRK